MKHLTRVLATLSSVIVMLGIPQAFAESLSIGNSLPSHPQVVQQPALPAPAAVPVYTPPRRGTPSAAHRVGGGTRAGKSFPTVMVLVPDHTGLTINEQPALYWFLTEPLDVPLEIVVSESGLDRPLFEYRLPPPAAAGIQRIRLADHNVHLTAGRQYEWSIALVVDAGHRSRDIFATGVIERIDPPPSVSTQITQSTRDEMPLRYAAAGLWYDALASVSDLIDAAPANVGFRKQRAALLEQVGLKDASQYDRATTQREAS